ncbi:hypothetical protein VA596_28140 [Amycolatopsis sp., V23-08]|uniref:Uncharacterized protein n=1 Tax=Amycolatopsis heterodermiae TaxID=3110235 RepID=A0ABU5RB12_9PSEU|nr:hypothetical protein [Amycolatopsis sp., V23-08]MEA5363433.1 hypothetical protein [Amycolatopsis sp., V23-08]
MARPPTRAQAASAGSHARAAAGLPALRFELADRLRGEVQNLKKELRGMDAAGIN